MTKTRQEIVERIIGERERNFRLPDSENDSAKSPNDWILTINFYLLSAIQRGSVPTSKEEFEDNVIKAMAIALAALEHSDLMVTKKLLKDEDG